MTEKKYYTWEQFDEDCQNIADWAKEKNFHTIYGIPRGGLIIAVKLSHLLDIPVMLNRDDVTKQTLIVDDIVDSGNTIQQLLVLLGHENVHVATLFHAEGAAYTPQFFARKKTAWVVFPWETVTSSTYDGTEL